MNVRGALALALCALLSACKGGGEAGDAAAKSGCIGSFVGGSDASATLDCTSFCTSPENPALAFDGSRGSHATYAFGPGSNAVIGVRAQSGVVFAAGHFAGALMHIPPAYAGTGWTVSTLLGGVVQETRTPANAEGGDLENPSGTDEFYGFTTSLPFDEVQFGLSGGAVDSSVNGGSGGLGPADIRVYEFCADR